MIESKEKIIIKGVDRCLDSQLWHACAGGMVQMPPVNSKVFYFPQGHAEHAHGPVDFRDSLKVPPLILSRVSDIKFMADPETDEVYARIRLIPLSNSDLNQDDGGIGRLNGGEAPKKPASFAKTLTQSDANNGGGFSVPRYCAETIFPWLDYTADPPVQTILAKDVHGETWKFRHIYRGTPRRHLLTTGWSTFVNRKKLVAGDSIVFLRAENGELWIGIRRVKKGIGAGYESPSLCNPVNGSSPFPYGGFPSYLRDDEKSLMRAYNELSSNGTRMSKGKVKHESVIKAATLAANGGPFEVVYYPRASTPEFCVKASLVKSAGQIRWCSGMRFKMPFETEGSSRISWFMGTVSSVRVADPLRWPDSPWRLLQVTWDEPDLLRNVKCVSPWLVELVSNMPAIHLAPFSPPRKKMKLPPHPDFLFDCQLPMPNFSGNLHGSGSPFGCLPNNSPAGMQGARHAHYSLSLSDTRFNKLQSSPFSPFPFPDHNAAPPRASASNPIGPKRENENVSCTLTMAHCAQFGKKSNDAKTSHFMLFGQPILIEQRMSLSCSADNSSSEGNADKMTNLSDCSGQPDLSSYEGLQWYKDHQDPECDMETGQCKVFMESEDVGRTIDLSVLGSYDELNGKLTNMFGIDNLEMLNHLLYRDATGAVKQLGDEPFSEFMKTTRRLTILMDSSSDNVESING